MKEGLKTAGGLSIALLAGSLVVAFANWGVLQDLESWGLLLKPNIMFSLLAALGPVFVAWLAKPPIK